MGKKSNLIFGGVLILFGLILLLFNFEIINKTIFIESISNWWPIGLILAGTLLIIKQKYLAIFIFIITILLLCSTFILPTNKDNTTVIEFNNIDLNPNTKEVEVMLDFGFGKINLSDVKDKNLLFSGSIEKLSQSSTPLSYVHKEDTAIISISRDDDINFQNIIGEQDLSLNWNVELNQNIPTNIYMNYGASDNYLDLRNLNIKNLYIDCGASDTTILFDNIVRNVKISSGATDFNLSFYSDPGIIVQVEGGLIDVELDGFKKIGSRYVSENYQEGANNTVIKIDSGLTSVSGGFVNE